MELEVIVTAEINNVNLDVMAVIERNPIFFDRENPKYRNIQEQPQPLKYFF